MLAILFALTATRAEGAVACPWPEDLHMEAYMLDAVKVNGDRVVVSGRARRLLFEDQLRACGYTYAADHFRRWRSFRQGVNWSVGVALVTSPFILGLPLIGAAVFGVMANRQKQEMIYSVAIDERPPEW